MLPTWLLPVNALPSPWTDVAVRLRPFIARRVSSTEIDDVLQDVFVRMQRGLASLKDEERFTSWLFQIARNSIAEHMRIRARHPLLAMEVEDDVPAAPPEDDREAARSLSSCVSMFIAQLSTPYREAVTLVELEGLTSREAAEMVGVSVTAMKSRVARGRGQLRKLFDDCCVIALDVRGKVTDFAPREKRCRPCV